MTSSVTMAHEESLATGRSEGRYLPTKPSQPSVIPNGKTSRYQEQENSNPIPFFYRLSLLYCEPIFALGGFFLLRFYPATFLAAMTPNSPQASASSSSPSSLPSSSTASSLPALSSVRVLTDQLAAMQLLFAFNLGVLLRFALPEGAPAPLLLRFWRITCAGMLLCDVLHVSASVRELSWAVVASPASRWRAEEWVNFGILGWMMAVRMGVVLGIGMGRYDRSKPAKQVALKPEGKNSDL